MKRLDRHGWYVFALLTLLCVAAPVALAFWLVESLKALAL